MGHSLFGRVARKSEMGKYRPVRTQLAGMPHQRLAVVTILSDKIARLLPGDAGLHDQIVDFVSPLRRRWCAQARRSSTQSRP